MFCGNFGLSYAELRQRRIGMAAKPPVDIASGLSVPYQK
jgi:hypothetical protein